jgi:hypothetical protein
MKINKPTTSFSLDEKKMEMVIRKNLEMPSFIKENTDVDEK